MMSEWISWSACSVSCGMGMRSRERYVKQYPEDGSLCQLHTEETEKCVVNDECCKFAPARRSAGTACASSQSSQTTLASTKNVLCIYYEA